MDKVQQSRRTFLKTAAAVAAAAPLAGCGVMDAQAKDVTWNREADVVVLGYGNAGTNAAIKAHDAGASVIVLEKMSIGGGNVAVSAGGFVIPTNRDAYFTYLKSLYELSRSEWDEGILNVFCDESMKLGDWMKKLDPRAEVGVYGHAGYQQLPGADSVNKCSLRGVPGLKGGDRLFNTFDRAVKARNIPVLFNTPARKLVREGTQIIGVEALQGNRPIYIRAKKAVIICTGGFQCNPELMQKYIYGNPMSYLGSPGNTGDGLLMAQAAGSGLWHMNSVSAPLGVQIPGLKSAINGLSASPPSSGSIRMDAGL